MAQVTADLSHEAFGGQIGQEEYQVAPIPRPGYHGKYPRWIGHKFEPDGSVRSFPGHGIMCPLPPQSSMYKALQRLRDDLKQQDCASTLVLLPPSVWHMTVYEGVSDQIRTRNGWPGELDPDCSLQECYDFVASKLANFDLGCESSFRMIPVGWEPIEDGIALKIAGADPAEEEKLRGLRERLANVLELRHPGFDKYSFHVGLAYQLRILEEHDKEKLASYLRSALEKLPKEFEIGTPSFCTYEDMLALDQRFPLVKQAD